MDIDPNVLSSGGNLPSDYTLPITDPDSNCEFDVNVDLGGNDQSVGWGFDEDCSVNATIDGIEDLDLNLTTD